MKVLNRMLGAAFVWLLVSTAVHAQAVNVTGIWSDSAGSYWSFVQAPAQEGRSAVVAIRLNSALDAADVLLGEVSANALAVSQPGGELALNATFGSSDFSGTLSSGDALLPLTGQLLIAYQGSSQDGIWQIDAQNYLMLLTVSSGGSALTGVFDITLTDAGGVEVDLYTGLTSGPTFAGLSISSPTSTLQLSFESASQLSGTYAVAAIPPRTSPFTAVRIIPAETMPVAP